MSLEINKWQIVYSCLSAVLTLLAYIISYFINFAETKDLAEMFFGSSMISIAIRFMSTNSQIDTSSSYPFTLLISLISFMALTFYTFIHDSLALLDDTLLVKCDMVNNTPILTSDDKIPTEVENVKFNCLDNFVAILLFIVSTLECTIFGVIIAQLTYNEEVHKTLPFILPVRFLQLLCISIYLRETRMATIWYILAMILNSATVGIFGLIKLPSSFNTEKSTLLFAVFSAILLGCFLYFGATAVHNSYMAINHSRWGSILVAILGFAIPVTFSIPVKKSLNELLK